MNFRCNPHRECRAHSLLALAFCALVLPVSRGAPTSSGSSEPASSAYTNQTYIPPATITDTGISSSSSSFSTSSSGFTYNDNYRPVYTRFFFPPVTPVLGERIPYRAAPFFTSRVTSITNQIAPYVGELFYPPLATRLSNEDLTKKQYEQLAAYRATRSSLLSALQTRLDGLRHSSPEVRERELSAFAREQAPQIDAFEQEAEAIREALIKGTFFQSSVGFSEWDANRSWRLGDNLRYESRVDEFKVIRAAAYFYPYLTTPQRRLLLELALELNEPLVDPSNSAALDAPLPFFYFAPETARARLPIDLPEAVTAKISAYQTQKAALKAELRSAIYQKDRSFFYFTRKEVLLPLAEQQAPRIAALDSLAEEIRHDLAAVPNPYRPARAEGSTDFAKRAIAITEESVQLFREIDQKKEELKKTFPTARVETTSRYNSYVIQTLPNRREGRSELKRVEAFQPELSRFNSEKTAQFQSLATRKDALMAEVLQTARRAPTANGRGGPAAPAPLDPAAQLRLKKFVTEYRERELWELYSLYDTAVFEPGLSPGQRRLLFAAGLQKLDLPIPSGSAQP